MKTKLLIILSFFLSLNAFAQNSNSLFTLKWGEDNYSIGGYIGTNLKYSTYESNPAGYVDFNAAFTINRKWAVGVSVTGLYYDKKLQKIVNDGTYHVYAGYTGIFIERMFSVSDNTIFSLSVLSGQGEAYYKYDREYREEHPWYQEIIDTETIYVIEPSVNIQHKISKNFYLGLTGSYRFTSPLRLTGTSDNSLKTFSGGLSIKYGVF